MSRPVFQFNDYELITARREIRKAGQPLPVEPKVYDLLLYLIERSDRSVSKEELQEAVWPNVIVTESALTRCIMKARQIVGDDAKSQSVIGTVHSRGYRFVAEVNDTSGTSGDRTGNSETAEETTVAVMPFVNLNPDDRQAFLADGLTQDITTDLSKNSWLFVIAQSSANSYRDRPIVYAEVAEELGIRYLVEGSVRRSGERLRVTAALVDAVTGVQEWSERYDRTISDLFEIQDDIAQCIVASLGSHVRIAEGRRATKADPSTLNVWGLLHRGMAISWSRFNRESNFAAEAMYRQALAIDPDSARAAGFLATSIAMKVSNGWSEDIEVDRREAWRLGRQAIALQPADAMLQFSFGHLNTCLGRAGSAVEILRRGIELDPNSAWGMGLLAFALTASGNADEAVVTVSKAIRLSPRDAARHWYLTMLSWAYLQKGQLEDAAREAQRSINAFAGWAVPWMTLAVARAGLGQLDDARAACQVAVDLDPSSTADGYERFFRLVARDDKAGDEIADWIATVRPSAQAR